MCTNNPNNADSYFFNANLGQNRTLRNYLFSYERSINALYQKILERNIPIGIDDYSLPMLFLIRHSIEIGLKINIKYLSQFSGKDFCISKIYNCHSLSTLFDCFQGHFRTLLKHLDIDTKNQKIVLESQCDKLIKKLEVIDPNGDAFRYPIDRMGNIIINRETTLNLLEVKNLFDETMKLLKYTEDVLNDQMNALD